jgi:GNAT superfamily N-acetyltransferase
MMADHSAQDPRIHLTEGAIPAYRAYLGYHLASGESCVCVAEAAGRVVGFCLLTISRNLPMFLPARYGYLSDLVVEPAWRRRGIGRALFEQSLGWLHGNKIQSVQLQFYAFNKSGAAFWQAMGFNPYYTRMWRDL